MIFFLLLVASEPQVSPQQAKDITEAQSLAREFRAVQLRCIKENAVSLDDERESAETIAKAAVTACAEPADKATEMFALELMLAKNFGSDDALSLAFKFRQELDRKFQDAAVLEILKRRREAKNNNAANN